MGKRNSPTIDFKNVTKNQKKSVLNRFQSFFRKPGTHKTNFSKSVSYSKSNYQKRNNNWSKKTQDNSENGENKFLIFLFKLLSLLKILLLPFLPIYFIGKFIFEKVSPYFSKLTLVKIAFTLVFSAIIFNFALLQVSGSTTTGAITAKDLNMSITQLISARKGQVYIQDMTQNPGSDRRYLPLTASQNVAHLYFNPFQLKGLLKQGLQLPEVASWISGSLNLPFDEIYSLLELETNKENPRKYVVIRQFISANQKAVVEFLKSNEETKRMMNQIGLGIEEREVRSYPQGPLLAQTIGYVPRFQVTRDEAVKIGGCKDTVLENERRGTASLEYSVGYYGIEQKFCSELSGLNGRRVFNNEINSDSSKEALVQDGASIYTTIDRNLQLKTEQILEKALKDNASGDRAPKNATAVVMEAKTGKILSMASAPTFEPENYAKFSSTPEVYRNQATGGDYEVGSVVKPLTIAAALDVYQLGKIGSVGQIIGIPPNFTFEDYDSKGMPYRALNGDTIYIRNSKGRSYKDLGYVGLDTCILFSMNTCLSRVVETMGNTTTRYYFEELFGFGRGTSIGLPGDSDGSRNSSIFSQDINCPSCYARYGFGQGFFLSPIQLMRAFTAIANRGVMTEPYMIEKIKYPDGTEDFGANPDSPIRRDLPKQIIKESVARQVTEYMVGLIKNTQPGVGANKARVPGYTVACKTGTSEKITNENGKVFSYEDNRNRGIYTHTMICFSTNTDNPLLFLVKIDEPRPGQVENFSGDTIGPAISELMKSTFQYLNVKQDQ